MYANKFWLYKYVCLLSPIIIFSSCNELIMVPLIFSFPTHTHKYKEQ